MLLYKELQIPSGLLLCIFPYVKFIAHWVGVERVCSIKLFKDPGSFHLVAPSSWVRSIQASCGERVRLGQVSTAKRTSHNTHTSLARTVSHVPHLPMGRLEVRNPGGREKWDIGEYSPVSTTLTLMWRFKKLWKTWRKENIMKKPFVSPRKFVEKLKKFFQRNCLLKN